VGELFGRHRDPSLAREVIEIGSKGSGVRTQCVQHGTCFSSVYISTFSRLIRLGKNVNPTGIFFPLRSLSLSPV
jgi:hypothetical protein